MCVHGGGAYMPASNRVAFLRAHSENVKRGFAGRSLRIWLKILRRNAWLILYHRIKSPNSREVRVVAVGGVHIPAARASCRGKTHRFPWALVRPSRCCFGVVNAVDAVVEIAVVVCCVVGREIC